MLIKGASDTPLGFSSQVCVRGDSLIALQQKTDVPEFWYPFEHCGEEFSRHDFCLE